MKHFTTPMLCAVLAFACAQARADLLISDTIPPPSQTVTFNNFGSFTLTAGPVQVGTPIGQDITWESTTSWSVIGTGTYGLGTNGTWTNNKTAYTGLNSSAGSMTYRFNDGPVSAVGGFVNYAPGTTTEGVVVEALDSADVVLESYNISLLAPILTVGQDQGAFRGISRTVADIAAFRVRNGYIVLDDLKFSTASTTASVPEPSSVALFGTVLAGVVVVLRRRRAQP